MTGRAMGTKRAAKRTVSDAHTGPLKKVKLDAASKRVVAGLEMAKEVPDPVQAMLAAMLPFSLSVASDERSEQQARVVEMMSEVLEVVRDELKKNNVLEEANVEQIKASKADRISKVDAAEARLGDAQQGLADRKAALADSSRSHMAAKGALQEAEAAHQKAERAMSFTKAEKEKFEVVFNGSFKTLMTGDWDEAGPKIHLDAVLPLTKLLAIDESLLTAAPAACAKPVSARGEFDFMVFGQLDENMKKKIADLEAKLQTEANTVAERREAVKVASDALEKSKENQKVTADAFTVARTEEQDAATALADAKAGVTSFEAEVQKAESAQQLQQMLLENYDTTNMTTFNTLKEKCSKQVETIEPEATPQPMEDVTASTEVAV